MKCYYTPNLKDTANISLYEVAITLCPPPPKKKKQNINLPRKIRHTNLLHDPLLGTSQTGGKENNKEEKNKKMLQLLKSLPLSSRFNYAVTITIL
jgi:hypothetical protein